MNNTLQNILATYREKGGNVIFLLQETQEAFGYIPRDAIDYFSEETGIAPSRFYGVVTFYSQFRLTKPGKNKITACCGTACHVRGAERIISRIERDLQLEEGQDTTADGEFTLEQLACVGACSIAPVVILNKEVHGKMNPDSTMREIRKLKENAG
ncbi:MAG: NADH-quinone oxidoreductase subunit NuoE [Thermodesulfovibrionales bacterium]